MSKHKHRESTCTGDYLLSGTSNQALPARFDDRLKSHKCYWVQPAVSVIPPSVIRYIARETVWKQQTAEAQYLLGLYSDASFTGDVQYSGDPANVERCMTTAYVFFSAL